MKLLAALSILLCIGCSSVGRDWSRADTTRQSVLIVLSIVDWGQTRDILSSPEYKELNPFISSSNVDWYFPVSIAAHTAVSYLLSPEARKTWQELGLIVQIGCVMNNYSLGVGVKF
jgi:hypothetical protein